MNKKLFVILILITIGMMGMAHGAKEIIYLEDNSKTTDPLELMKVISVSEQIISDIEDKYAKEWNTQKEAIEKSYQPASNKIEQSSPELWETDRQFEKRKESEISNLTNQMNSEVSEVYSVLEGKKQEELVHYQEWLANGQEKLFQSRTVDEGIQITPLEYLRNERLWPMHISVDHPIMNFKDFQIFIKFKDDGKKITQSVIPNIQYVDGYYFAISDNYWTSDNASSTGWYEIVEFDVRNGRIENVVFDAIDDDWESRKALSKDGDDDMVRFGGSSDEWHVQTERAEKYLEKTQNPLSIRYIDDAGHVDDIAGVSISVEPFFALIVEALAAGPISPVAPVFVPPAPTPSRVSGERYLEVFFSDSTQIFLESTSYSGIGIQQEIVDFDKAVKEKKLSAQIGWNITQDKQHDRYNANLQSLMIINKVNGLEYGISLDTPLITNSYMVVSDEDEGQNNQKVLETSIIFDVIPSGVLIIPPGESLTPEFQFSPANIIDSSYEIDILDKSVATIRGNRIIANQSIGETELIFVANQGLFRKVFNLSTAYRVGSIGPAGGYVIFDAGDYSKGWRYIEASPKDAYNWQDHDVEVSWGDTARYDESTKVTSTSIGSGGENTTQIANYINSKKNAAQIALDYEVNGYDDWFLPSKDELNVMITFFNNNSQKLEGYSYWSSSFEGRLGFGESEAWLQNSYSLEQELEKIYQTIGSIRPIRYF